MLSEYSDGHALQAMRGPDRKTRIGSDATSIEPRSRGNARFNFVDPLESRISIVNPNPAKK